jgi:two-component system, NtrC family, sensor kinase
MRYIKNLPATDSSSNRRESMAARFQSCLSSLSISGKISFGYAITLGIAFAGTTLGIIIGESYQQHSQKLIEDALEETELLHELKTDLLEAKNLQQGLFFLLDKPEIFRQHYQLFLEETTDMELVWKKLKDSYEEADVEETSAEREAFEKIQQDFDSIILTNFHKAEKIYQPFNQQNITTEQNKNLRKIIIDYHISDSSIKVTEIVEKIDKAAHVIDEEVEEAKEAIAHFAKIRLTIIFISIAISIVLAIIITTYMIKTLIYPLQAVTRIAEQVSQESNLELQVPVTTSDEVGTLARAFNQMIQRIKELLIEQQTAQEALKMYSQTLEDKVQQRTEELNEKNLFLQKTLDEVQRTKVQIIQSEKMSSLGQLVAGVAHEINNPVSFIYGNLSHASEYTQDLLKLIELFQEVYPQPEDKIKKQMKAIDLEYLKEDLPQMINSMTFGAERIREIVKSLRNFSRTDEAEYKEADIHQGIDGTLMILRHRLKASGEHQEITITKEYGKIPLVTCYPGKLNQVFMNILSNAIDALEEYNQSRTKEEIKINPNEIKIYTQVINNNWVRIGIKDNGVGIPQKILSKLFDPFFTTKAVGKGTGLGLSISYQIIVEKHGGRLFCHSEPGLGTEFTIEIPIYK